VQSLGKVVHGLASIAAGGKLQARLRTQIPHTKCHIPDEFLRFLAFIISVSAAYFRSAYRQMRSVVLSVTAVTVYACFHVGLFRNDCHLF
jgi:hypothetical protein